ncbi:hypothetical protein, partial [Pseudoalteromonas sp.]|uniref:hypothetical protein n=1 Tax=Pseudoalteromonas sp. TaxID=53249 RepID=UPI00356729AA
MTLSSVGESAEAATITINGTGERDGVLIRNDDAQISSVKGDIRILGIGDNGVGVVDGAVVSSTGKGADAATITIDGAGGTGSHADGVVIFGNRTRVMSTDGDIKIIGSAIGVDIKSSSAVTATGAATIGVT